MHTHIFGVSAVKSLPACNVRDSVGARGSVPGSGRFPWRRKRQPTAVFLPGKSQWTEEPGGLQSMGLQKNWTQLINQTTTKICIHTRIKDFQVFLPYV